MDMAQSTTESSSRLRNMMSHRRGTRSYIVRRKRLWEQCHGAHKLSEEPEDHESQGQAQPQTVDGKKAASATAAAVWISQS